MPGWKVALHELYNLGGTAMLSQLQVTDNGIHITDHNLRTAISYGLAVSSGRQDARSPVLFSLTVKGYLWCQGKFIEGRGIGTAKSPKAMGFRATWLLSLPEGVRITATSQSIRACIGCEERTVYYHADDPRTAFCVPCSLDAQRQARALLKLSDHMEQTAASPVQSH